MRLPRFRLRTLMILIAGAAVTLAVWAELLRRRARFTAIAKQHTLAAMALVGASPDSAVTATDEQTEKNRLLRYQWHWALGDKYIYAAQHPWLPVPPDPPEPK